VTLPYDCPRRLRDKFVHRVHGRKRTSRNSPVNSSGRFQPVVRRCHWHWMVVLVAAVLSQPALAQIRQTESVAYTLLSQTDQSAVGTTGEKSEGADSDEPRDY